MDDALFGAINGLAGRNHQLDSLVAALSAYGPFLLVALLAAMWFAPRADGKRGRFQRAAILAGLATMLALAANQLIIHIWQRPRPFMALHAILLLPASADPSFPSDHATFAFAIAVAIFLASRGLGALALFYAAMLGVSRAYVGEHYVSDVVGGAVCGSLAAVLTSRLMPRLERWIVPVLRRLRRVGIA